MSPTKEATIIAALSTLPSSHLSHLTLSLSAVHRRNLRRLAALLSSPTLFSFSLRHLHSLSRHQKSLLIARHLLSDLTLLQSHLTSSTAPPPLTTTKLRDLDAALLLLLLCELHHHDRDFLGAPPSRWRHVLCDYVSGSILRLPTFGGSSDAETLIQFVDSVRRCWNLVSAMGLAGGNKGGAATAASPAAVVALPSVVVSGGGGECVVCKEEMRDGREVCQLPCGHLFHWVCILPWLKKRDTCPCCRRRLPSDDVRREIERLLEDLVRIGGGEM